MKRTEDIIRRLQRNECSDREAIIHILERILEMSTQLDLLTAAQATETQNLATLQSTVNSITGIVAPDLSGAINAANANASSAAAINTQLSGLITPASVTPPPAAAPPTGT